MLHNSVGCCICLHLNMDWLVVFFFVIPACCCRIVVFVIISRNLRFLFKKKINKNFRQTRVYQENLH